MSRLRFFLQSLDHTYKTRLLLLLLLNRRHPEFIIIPWCIHLPVARDLQIWLQVVENAAVLVARVDKGFGLQRSSLHLLPGVAAQIVTPPVFLALT